MIKEFEGYCSGDYESFVWAVDKETFLRLAPEYKQEEDMIKFEKSPFKKGMYMIYPDDIFKDTKEKKLRIKIEYEIID